MHSTDAEALSEAARHDSPSSSDVKAIVAFYIERADGTLDCQRPAHAQIFWP